jgi:hypothetical protein
LLIRISSLGEFRLLQLHFRGLKATPNLLDLSTGFMLG